MDFMTDWYKDFCGWLLKTLEDFVRFLIAKIEPILTNLFSFILEKLPVFENVHVEELAPYLKIANYWFPLDFALGLFVIYLNIQILVFTYRTIKKHIPTLS